MNRIIFVAAIILTLSGCSMGEEKARLHFTDLSNNVLNIQEATIELKKGDNISFWADMDIEYQSELGLVYNLEITKDSVLQAEKELDALETNPTLMSTSTTIGNKTSRSYKGKMSEYTAAEDGAYIIKAILRSSGNPTLTLKKADLVVSK